MINWIHVLICCLWGLMVSLLVIPYLLVPRDGVDSWRARLHRRSREMHHTHGRSISRLGGCALGACFLIVAALAGLLARKNPGQPVPVWGLMIGSLAMLGLGLADDLRPLGARKKLIGQILVAALAWCLGIRIEVFNNPFSGEIQQFGMLGLPATVLWLVGMANLINLIDGLDGLAAGISLMLMVLLSWTGVDAGLSFSVAVAAGMAGSLLGFLGYNFPPAKIYLGDGGAYFLGFLAGALSLVNSQKGTVIAALAVPLFVLGLPIIDTSLAIIRRGLKGLPVFRPDRGHIHHLMLGEGFSRRAAVLVLYAISVVFLLVGVGISWSGRGMVPVFLGILVLVLLVMGRSLSFSRHWFSIGKVFSNSLEVRRHMPRVMGLCAWLELEAPHARSPDELWESYRFGAERLGLCRLVIALDHGQRFWISDEQPNSEKPLRGYRITAGSNGTSYLEFAALEDALPPQALRLTSEILAESWLRSARKWTRATEKEFRFEIDSGTAPEPPGVIRDLADEVAA